jgi:hypothetical protein
MSFRMRFPSVSAVLSESILVKPSAIGASTLHAQNQMHSARLRIDAHVGSQGLLEALRRRFPSLAIQLSHALDMTGKMAFRHESGDHGLREVRRAA